MCITQGSYQTWPIWHQDNGTHAGRERATWHPQGASEESTSCWRYAYSNPIHIMSQINRRPTNTSFCFRNFVTVLLYPLHCFQNDNSLPSHCRCCIYRRFTVLHLKRWVTAFRSNYFLNLRTSFHRVWCLSPPAVSFCRNRCRSACKRNCWFLRYEGQTFCRT